MIPISDEDEDDGPYDELWMPTQRKITDRLSAPADRILFHYTNAAAVLSIAETQTLRLTHFSYLNDPTEIEFARKIAGQTLEYFLSDRDISRSARDLVSQALEGIGTPLYDEPYVFSFSESDEVLELWRAYGDNGSGFALGFRPQSGMRGLVAPIEYLGENDSSPTMVEWIQSFVENCEAQQDIGAAAIRVGSFRLVGLLMTFLPYFKHLSYQNEREWRLVQFKSRTSMGAISLRATQGQLVPYIEYYFQGHLCVDKVTGGPRQGDDRQALPIRKCFKDVNWQRATIPYRG